MINKETNPNLTTWLAVPGLPGPAKYNANNYFAFVLFFWALKFHGGQKTKALTSWACSPLDLKMVQRAWSSGCCSQIVSTMGTLLHGDRIPERNRSNFKRQEMQNRYPCYLLTQTFSCNNFNFTSASVLIGSDFCLTQICHSLQHLTQLLLHLA